MCWTLDALFHGLKEGGPRLLFKGGTSLSKGFGLINRFSEDIDVTVFRHDIGEPATIEELNALSNNKRRARLDAIKAVCQAYINGPLRNQLTQILKDRLKAAGLDAGAARVEVDDTDADKQTLLIWYPTATPQSDYVRAAIKIESGAKSALDPNSEVPIKPYVDDDLSALDLTVPEVRTVDPERTFWDKVVILHGLRRWFDKRGELRGGGQRVSRHYYDLHKLLPTQAGASAIEDPELGADCVAHARMFFNRPDFDLASAAPGSFALAPHDRDDRAAACRLQSHDWHDLRRSARSRSQVIRWHSALCCAGRSSVSPITNCSISRGPSRRTGQKMARRRRG
ncbi:hypothetical protein ACVWWG_009305 [Bradyrhizobium sp. LB7.2]